MKEFRKENEGKKFKWLMGGIGWPVQGIRGFACVIGLRYPEGFERPYFHLLVEAEHEDTRDLCRDVLGIDAIYSPEVWLADKENDAALAILHKENDDVRLMLAGKQYDIGQSPLHRRIISVSSSELFKMSHGVELVLSTISDLLSESHPRLFLPNASKVIGCLGFCERKDKLLWEDLPILAGFGLAIYELVRTAENEQSQQYVTPQKKESNKLTRGINKSGKSMTNWNNIRG